jgi:hypothetical protein
MAGPCFRRLFAGFSARDLGFDLGRVFTRFLVNVVAVGQGFLLVLQFSRLSFRARMLNFYNLRANISLWVNGRSLGTLKKNE